VSVLACKKQQILSVAAGALLLAFGSACASHHAYLVPAPTDQLALGGRAAQSTADDVNITVTPNDWSGRPSNLYKRVTPLKVKIQNNSNQALRITYQDFDLQGPKGNTYAALPPSEIKGTQYVGQNDPPRMGAHVENVSWQDADHDNDAARSNTRVIITPGFDSDDFYYAPYWDYGYAGLGPWPYAWAPDWGYYNTYYPYMQAYRLPTRSMIRKAIPEGVIAPHGYVRGFLYFKKVDPDLHQVTFVAHLQNAQTGRQFETVRIPFNVRQK
jgi:hypothetical protein